MASSNPTSDVKSADLDLVGRIRAGDGPAFEQLYKQHSAMPVRYCPSAATAVRS